MTNQPSIIKQLSDIVDRFDNIVNYEMDVCGNNDEDLIFYRCIEDLVFKKIQEIEERSKK